MKTQKDPLVWRFIGVILLVSLGIPTLALVGCIFSTLHIFNLVSLDLANQWGIVETLNAPFLAAESWLTLWWGLTILVWYCCIIFTIQFLKLANSDSKP